ncbi:HAD-superfamily hydrolase [Martensiomyces pterosporus]|nr:HAD-superfamily hydrolase [Martensiomyces pterosporus]
MLYPPKLKSLKYDKTFAIRGISYDRETGWMFKLDSNYNIALDTIHYGREPLRDLEEVYSLHNGPHIPPDYAKSHLQQLNDIYSIPEATLLADVIQYFSEHNIPFHPRYLAEDIRAAGEYIHKGDGISVSPLHAAIMSNLGEYLGRAPELVQILESLKAEGKRLFLLTNSGYDYVNAGLSYMFNTSKWRDLFDVVIVSARKPSWYLSHRPFRLVPTESGRGVTSVQPWAFVDRFEDGQVYSGGNLMSFCNITGYTGRNVMYFGDHIYSDLRDPTIQKGWYTGAIVGELNYELSVVQSSGYRQSVSYIQLIEKILKHSQQETRSPEFMQLPAEDKEAFRQLLDVGRMERRRTRWKLRDSFNTNFGSVFRTEKYPSLFATKIKSFANVYTADLSNLGAYPSDFVFYPKRMTLPHETRMPEVDDLLDEVLRM